VWPAREDAVRAVAAEPATARAPMTAAIETINPRRRMSVPLMFILVLRFECAGLSSLWSRCEGSFRLIQVEDLAVEAELVKVATGRLDATDVGGAAYFQGVEAGRTD
jgi:hypothetical protein